MKSYFLVFVFISSFVLGQSFVSTDIKSIDQNDLNGLIKNREGKLLLINVWATWCVPCREEFPDLVKLSQLYKNELDVVAISVDFIEDIETKVKPFLKQKKVNFPVFLHGFKNDEQLINYFSKTWNGAIPATFIFNQKGRKVKFLEGKHSFKSFSSLIENLKD